MTTFVVQIGNSDDKLSQARWSRFISMTRNLVETMADEVHFVGTSFSNSPYQNACLVFTISPDGVAPADVLREHDKRLEVLERALAGLAYQFDQDSIALTPGITRFITSRRSLEDY